VPTYQYACRECDHAFEQVQSFSDDTLTDCPECKGRLRKVFNAVGVVFKGSGFYRTDSRKKESSSETAASPAKADSAPAAATPATSSPSSSGSSSGDSGSSGSSTTTTKSPQPTAS
jgi:putative FmdB family regulatory protein